MGQRVRVILDSTHPDRARALLVAAGLEVGDVGTGERIGFASALLGDGGADLAALDATGSTGGRLDRCRGIRSGRLPFIVLTEPGDTAATVRGLGLGADDCVSILVEPSELAARVHAVLRRRRRLVPRTWEVRDLTIDEAAVVARRDDRDLGLTAKELRLLVALAAEPGDVRSRGELLDLVWGCRYLGDSRMVDMAVLRLRRKLGAAPRPPAYVTSVRSVGYRFEHV